MQVLPGYLHQVQNVQPCVKVAFDYIEARHLQSCCWMHRDLFPLTKNLSLPQDYLSVLEKVWDELLHLAQQLHK